MTTFIQRNGLSQKVHGVPKPRQRAVCTDCNWFGPLRTKGRLGTKLADHDLIIHTRSTRHTEGE